MSPKIIGNDTIYIAYEFLFIFHCNYGHILYYFQDTGWKSQLFHTQLLHNNPWGKTVMHIFMMFYYNQATSLDYQVV